MQILARRFPGDQEARIFGSSGTIVLRSPFVTSQGISKSPSGLSDTAGIRTSLIQWTEIERVQARASGARKGSIIGAVTVGILALAIGVAAASDPFLGGGHNNTGPVIALTLLGVVTGAGAGALIGRAIPGWEDVYRARRTP